MLALASSKKNYNDLISQDWWEDHDIVENVIYRPGITLPALQVLAS